MRHFFLTYRSLAVRVGSVCLDLLVAASSFLAAYVFAYGWNRIEYVPGILDKITVFTVSCAFCFAIFDVSRASWRYASVSDLVSVIKASVFAVAIYTLGAFLLSRGENVPRSVPVLTLIFLIGGLSSVRLAYRIVTDGGLTSMEFFSRRHRARGRAVLLLGLSHNAESFIRNTKRENSHDIAVVGVIDDSPINYGRLVHGVKVFGGLEKLEGIVNQFKNRGVRISELVVAEHQPSRKRLSEILESASVIGLKVTRIPDLTTTSSITNNLLIEPKPIEIGDLLGRPEVTADVVGVAQLIDGRIVLATGAAGSIGSELCRQIAAYNPSRLIITDASEFHLYMLDKELRQSFPDLPITTRLMNVRERSRVDDIFAEFKPEVVFHAAALKHVPLVEENPLEAIKTNVFGTCNVANAAMSNGVSVFVMISTDKAVNPTNVMGATKRAAEAYCQALDLLAEKTCFKTVRFGNVLGSNGSVVPRFQEQIAAGGPVTVTHPNIVRFFMTIPEAVSLVLHASAHALRQKAERGRIMVLDMGKPVLILDLAERMIQLAGFKPKTDIEIVFTGLRPGEKLYEELFDPSEVVDRKTEEGYVIASPRVMDKALLARTLDMLKAAAAAEDSIRAVELLSHIVPEYHKQAPGAAVAVPPTAAIPPKN
jgi:O-antigen biosynthesis protein WbqV